jgi:cell fate regulator YaaT (PSP1 superfamily)
MFYFAVWEGLTMARIIAVRYGSMGHVGNFAFESSQRLDPGEPVIVRTNRGVEWGVAIRRLGKSENRESDGELLRKATQKDARRLKDIQETNEPEEYRTCKEFIEKFELPMKLIKAEHLFGDNKIIFFFMAEERVDFRQLVKELAQKYKTRIEMRQIGVRDEARLLGEIGPCGRELCCHAFLNVLKPVPMKVAKSQKSTLDPAKISGCCGRLKCCLLYEEETYKQLRANLPRRGASVETPEGKGIVVGHHVLMQEVCVRFQDKSEQMFAVSDIKATGPS